MRLASAFVLVLGIAVFADSALAGNGNGNGNGNVAAVAASAAGLPNQDSSPGNSANAPGQARKDAASASSEAPALADVSGQATSPTTNGVKPSNETDHETHAAASSDQTKEYGNGRTAGEIAMKNGARPNTILHGPGNSQPHKAAPCAGGHEIDVHALKAKGHQKTCGTSSPPPGSTPVPHRSSDTNRSSDPHVTGGDPARPTGRTPEHNSSPKAPVSSGSGVEGSSGVLAPTQAVGRGSLPFTGLPLWIVAMVAVALIVVGLALRRQASL